MPVKVISNSENIACMGGAILAGVANGIGPSIEAATEQFISFKDIYYPNPDNVAVY